MGDYKGRLKLRQRKRRFAKAERIKALAAAKKRTIPTQEESRLEAIGSEVIASCHSEGLQADKSDQIR